MNNNKQNDDLQQTFAQGDRIEISKEYMGGMSLGSKGRDLSEWVRYSFPDTSFPNSTDMNEKKSWKARKVAALSLLNCRGKVDLTIKDKQKNRGSKEWRRFVSSQME